MSRPERFIVHNRFIRATECDELFRQASIVVLPYIEATQSGVIPLAYSYAKPVVATRVGALAEVVDDGKTGRLVPPADSESLAAAIVELLRDPVSAAADGHAQDGKSSTMSGRLRLLRGSLLRSTVALWKIGPAHVSR